MNKGTLFKPLPEPNIDDWQSDAAFVKHFLEGANPMVSKSFRFLFLLILDSHIDKKNYLCSQIFTGFAHGSNFKDWFACYQDSHENQNRVWGPDFQS